MKDNYCDYSSIIIKEKPALYDFCLFTPKLAQGYSDNDGWVDSIFYAITNQHYNAVPEEMSSMDLYRIKEFLDQSITEHGLVVEIGVWRNPNSGKMTSTELILDQKSDTCDYLGIDIEERPHVVNRKPRTSMLTIDSGKTDEIIAYIKEKYNKQIDFLFIDGLHSIEQVKKEIALINIVKKGGVIGFHDISVHAGPNVWMDAFDPLKFTIHKFRADDDWGIGFIVKNF